MSHEVAGVGWLVSWFDQWRGRPHQASFGVDENAPASHLKTAVEQLPVRERQVLLLHVNSELTYWQIADRLGLAEQAVLGDLSNAYSQLRVQLSTDELVPMSSGAEPTRVREHEPDTKTVKAKHCHP